MAYPLIISSVLLIKMKNKTKAKFYKLRRYLGSYFTYECASCGKYVRGSCLCKDCEAKLPETEVCSESFAFAYYYEGVPKDVMLRYKFHGDYAYCRDTLCDWLLEAYKNLPAKEIDFATCVPTWKLKSTRLTELSKEFCAMAEIPFRDSVLKKTCKTEKQHRLSAEDRRKNLVGAFEATGEVKSKTVLLIDDIYTTGSTIAECSKALSSKGAAKILVLTVLKTSQ